MLQHHSGGVYGRASQELPDAYFWMQEGAICGVIAINAFAWQLAKKQVA